MEPSSHFYTGASHVSCTSDVIEKPALNCLPALFLPFESALIKKGVPEIPIQPIGLRLTPSNQSYMAIAPSTSSPTNRSSSFLTNQDSAFGPIKLEGFGALICMRMDQSGTRVGVFCGFKLAAIC